MPEVPDRDERERRIAAALLLLFEDQYDFGDDSQTDWPIVSAGIGSIAWPMFESRLRQALTPELQGIYTDSAEQLARQQGIEIPSDRLSQEASDWATRYGGTLAREMAGNTQSEIRRVTELERNGAITAEEASERISRQFSPQRADIIGVTETTRAGTAGEFKAVREFKAQTGITLIAIWRTSGAGNVCPICEDLEGTVEDWQEEYPSGPPAHPGCNCNLEYEPMGDVEPSMESAPAMPVPFTPATVATNLSEAPADGPSPEMFQALQRDPQHA